MFFVDLAIYRNELYLDSQNVNDDLQVCSGLVLKKRKNKTLGKKTVFSPEKKTGKKEKKRFHTKLYIFYAFRQKFCYEIRLLSYSWS